ncbi:Y-family DNA polymerase, partial [Oceaniglobus roseus]|uniref:Y-family DNA polymerase n=1 Tax=Oceaniglobus roseus TaxID=1737570 RepID=UPI000C7E8B8D
MINRRILSLWFPRMGAERLLRRDRGGLAAVLGTPFAVVADRGGAQVLSSLSEAAEAAGLRQGQPLRDAMAICPDLVTRVQVPQAEAAFLAVLRRWAGKFSPWVGEQGTNALVADLTGCAHLFGGEAALMDQLQEDCADLGLTLRAAIADTVGGAWALARYSGQSAPLARSGDAIDQEAHATRSRAAKRRHWERGGAAPLVPAGLPRVHPIAPPGQTRQALAPLPVAALRLEEDAVAELTRLGLRRIEDLANQPRAALARRFGRMLVRRLDQALGVEPEPVSPAAPVDRFAVRLSLPDPIGLESDLLAALDRLLPALGAKLAKKGRGARVVRMQCFRADGTLQAVEIGLARPSAEPERIRPLLAMKLDAIDAGFGIDTIRIEAVQTEPVSPRQHAGHAEAAA